MSLKYARQLVRVDVAPGHDANHFAATSFARQRGGYRCRSRTLGNYVVPLGDDSYSRRHLIERSHQRAIQQQLASGNIPGKTTGALMPSTKLGVCFTSTGSPAANDAASGAPVSTSAAYTLTSGLSERKADAILQLKPPPP